MASKFSNLRLPTFRESLVIAAVLALVGFFSMNSYNPNLGVLGNAMRGRILVTEWCPVPPSHDGLDFGQYSSVVGQPEPAPPFLCGFSFRYRWVLIGLVLLVAGCWFFEPKRRDVKK